MKNTETQIRIAVCDDLRDERDRLMVMLAEYFAAKSLRVEYSEYESGEALLSAFSRGAFSLLFLDIYMDGFTGIETARGLKNIDPDCIVIFTTTSLEHGADAFDVEAFHYITKPVEKGKLFSVLDKWHDVICRLKTIDLKCGRTIRSVYVSDILYIDVLGRNSTVHTFDECIETSMSLAAIQEMLPEGQFCRPIRYCLAAFSHIKAITENGVLLDNGETLAVSRLEREQLRGGLAAYRLRKLRRR